MLINQDMEERSTPRLTAYRVARVWTLGLDIDVSQARRLSSYLHDATGILDESLPGQMLFLDLQVRTT